MQLKIMVPILAPRSVFFRLFPFCIVILSLLSCSTDDEIAQESRKDLVNITAPSSTYKGIFASSSQNYRGIFQLNLPGGMKDMDLFNQKATASITIQTGETFTVNAVDLFEKSSSFKMFFESEDFSFNFTLDSNNNPVITDVIFKKEASSIIAAEETEETPVTPVTGTYKCTNCHDNNSTINGIDINNNERTFNMLLTKEDGKTSLSIQALVGILVDTKLLVNETCTSNDQYTFCAIKSGENFTTKGLTWSGVQRYTNEGSNSEECSGIAGIFEYTNELIGSIKGEFKSDNHCPNSTYFISSTGNDNNSGLSPQDPWKTIQKVNTIDLQPGDAVLFEGGGEYPGTIELDTKDGNNGANPVIIASYGTGKAVIKAGQGFGINAYNTAGFRVDNLIFAGNGMNSNNGKGISFYNDLPGNTKLDYLEITNCEVYGFRDIGISIGGGNGNSGYTNVLIENNKVHEILDKGIFSFGVFSKTKTGYAHSNLTVRNCEVYNIKGYSKKEHSGNGIVLSDVQYSTIEHCTVYDSGSGNTNCGGPAGIWYWDADSVTIQYSEVYNMSSGTSNCDGAGFDMDGGVTNGLMQYNYSHDNDGGGFIVGQFTGARPMANITVRYNISENDAKTNGGSLYLFNGDTSASMKDIFVYNNTVYLNENTRNTAPATIKYCYWMAMNNNIHFYNNILNAENGAAFIDVPAGYNGNFAGNLYFTTGDFKIAFQGKTYTSLEEFRKTGKEVYQSIPQGYEGNPLLNNPGNGGTIGFGKLLSSLNAYKIPANSPAVDGGITVPFETGTRDYYGNNYLNSKSRTIGAHQDNSIKSKAGIVLK